MIVNIFYTLILILSINAIPTIDFSSDLKSGDGYKVEGDYIYINRYGYNPYNEFNLNGINIDKNIIISTSAKLYLNSLTIANTGKLTPIIIDKNCDVTIDLRGRSSFVDSSENENGGVLYLREGAKLTIAGSGTLNLMVNKLMAINGANSTSLEINGGTIKIISTESSAGGIKLGNNIIFNGPNFSYEAISGKNPAISSFNIIINSGNLNINSGEGKIFYAENSIILNSGSLDLLTRAEKAIEARNSLYIKGGNLNLISTEGQGILAEKNIYFGIKDENNNNLQIYINAFTKGLEAEGIEIYSGIINIKSKGDGIKISSDKCREEKCYGKCSCYMKIYGGNININSDENGIDSNGDIYIAGGKLILLGASNGNYQPITQIGLLKITNGTVFAGGADGNGGIISNTTQISSFYYKHVEKGDFFQIYENNNNLILNLTIPKNIEYFYFNHPLNYIIKINGVEIGSSEAIVRTLISSEYKDYDYDYSTYSNQNSEKNINDIANSTFSEKIIDDSQNEKISIKTIILEQKDNEIQEEINKSTIIPDNTLQSEIILSSLNIQDNSTDKKQNIITSYLEQNINYQIDTNIDSTNIKQNNEELNEEIITSFTEKQNSQKVSDSISYKEDQIENNVINSQSSELSNGSNYKENIFNSNASTDNEDSYNIYHFIEISNCIILILVSILF